MNASKENQNNEHTPFQRQMQLLMEAQSELKKYYEESCASAGVKILKNTVKNSLDFKRTLERELTLCKKEVDDYIASRAADKNLNRAAEDSIVLNLDEVVFKTPHEIQSLVSSRVQGHTIQTKNTTQEFPSILEIAGTHSDKVEYTRLHTPEISVRFQKYNAVVQAVMELKEYSEKLCSENHLGCLPAYYEDIVRACSSYDDACSVESAAEVSLVECKRLLDEDAAYYSRRRNPPREDATTSHVPPQVKHESTTDAVKKPYDRNSAIQKHDAFVKAWLELKKYEETLCADHNITRLIDPHTGLASPDHYSDPLSFASALHRSLLACKRQLHKICNTRVNQRVYNRLTAAGSNKSFLFRDLKILLTQDTHEFENEVIRRLDRYNSTGL